MYAKSLVVFFLCTALVLGIVVVLNYEASAVGSQVQALPTSQSSCLPGDDACPRFTIISASIRTQNTTDQLGVANPTYLSLEFNVTGGSPLAKVYLFIGNTSAGSVGGPFKPGLNHIVNLTLMATVIVTPGKLYTLSVQGLDSKGSYALESETIVARGQVPY